MRDVVQADKKRWQKPEALIETHHPKQYQDRQDAGLENVQDRRLVPFANKALNDQIDDQHEESAQAYDNEVVLPGRDTGGEHTPWPIGETNVMAILKSALKDRWQRHDEGGV